MPAFLNIFRHGERTPSEIERMDAKVREQRQLARLAQAEAMDKLYQYVIDDIAEPRK